jgi:hypothetical protein
MKILMVSDSHGKVGGILDAIEREKPDVLFHMGDVIRDAQTVQSVCPELPIHAVVGNCDGWAAGPESLEVTVEGLRFLLVHGHCHQAKLGNWTLLKTGREGKYDGVCYGHTHQPVAQLQPEGFWLINPGTVSGVHNKATYAVGEIRDGELTVQIKEL